MPPQPSPAPSPEGPLGALAAELRQLHGNAGSPSLREIAARAKLSHDTVHRVLTQKRSPRLSSLTAVVEALDGDVEHFRSLWIASREQGAQRSGITQPIGAKSRASPPVGHRHGEEKEAGYTTPSPPQHQTFKAWPANSFLGKLSNAARNEMLHLGQQRIFGPGIPLARQGEEVTPFILITSGLVKVSISADNGVITLLGFRGPGDLLGELEQRPSSSTVTTIQGTTGRRIARRELLTFLQLYPEATIALMGVLADRLRRANQRRLDLAAYPVAVRLARILVELAETYGTESKGGLQIGIALSQNDLASLAGAALPTIEKALRQLDSLGVLERRYRSISIKDTEALRQLAGESRGY